MKFGLFFEHQIQRPWAEDDEHRVLIEALEQAEAADRLGFDHLWVVEHHFLEEYSHSSAPEVFLGACAARTKQIRLGHGIVLMPPRYNHPARVAERIATLDLLSGGRVEFGTGTSGSRTELEGFGIDPAEKQAMWGEAVSEVAEMMSRTPYPGYEGRYFSMPARNVVPKPLQKPHPPLWCACSRRETIHGAAKHGIGALTFSFVDPADARGWVDDYYRTLEKECVPIGRRVDPNIAMVAPLSLHSDPAEALRRAREGFEYFLYGLGHYYGFGIHHPGLTSLNDGFRRVPKTTWRAERYPGMGTPEEVRRDLRAFEAAGVDQVVFLLQSGRTEHRHILETLERFAAEVMPEFKARAPEAEAKKAARLAPIIEAALARKPARPEIPPHELPAHEAYGRSSAKAPGLLVEDPKAPKRKR